MPKGAAGKAVLRYRLLKEHQLHEKSEAPRKEPRIRAANVSAIHEHTHLPPNSPDAPKQDRDATKAGGIPKKDPDATKAGGFFKKNREICKADGVLKKERDVTKDTTKDRKVGDSPKKDRDATKAGGSPKDRDVTKAGGTPKKDRDVTAGGSPTKGRHSPKFADAPVLPCSDFVSEGGDHSRPHGEVSLMAGRAAPDIYGDISALSPRVRFSEGLNEEMDDPSMSLLLSPTALNLCAEPWTQADEAVLQAPSPASPTIPEDSSIDIHDAACTLRMSTGEEAPMSIRDKQIAASLPRLRHVTNIPRRGKKGVWIHPIQPRFTLPRATEDKPDLFSFYEALLLFNNVGFRRFTVSDSEPEQLRRFDYVTPVPGEKAADLERLMKDRRNFNRRTGGPSFDNLELRIQASVRLVISHAIHRSGAEARDTGIASRHAKIAAKSMDHWNETQGKFLDDRDEHFDIRLTDRNHVTKVIHVYVRQTPTDSKFGVQIGSERFMLVEATEKHQIKGKTFFDYVKRP